MKKLFKKYKDIKAQLNFSYKGYEIHNLLSYPIVLLVYKRVKYPYKHILKAFLTRKIQIASKSDVLFSMGAYDRQDHYKLLNNIKTNVSDDILDLSNIKRTFKISLKNMYIAFRYIFLKKVDLNFMSKLGLWGNAVYTLNLIEDLEKLNSNTNLKHIKKFCSFCSTHQEEGMLDYFFQKNGIETYTLQHGLYFINYSHDSILLENVITNNFLVWGQYSKDELIKNGVTANKIKVAGYPFKCEKLQKKEQIHQKVKIVVLFARIEFDSNNLALIEIIKQVSQKISMAVEFKLHPSLDMDKYTKLAKQYGFTMSENLTMEELFLKNNYDLSIAYNSTAYYNSYAYNCISLRYKDSQADNSINVCDDDFSTIDELEQKIQYFKTMNSDDKFWQNTQKRLEYILGVGVYDYSKILRR